MKGITGGLKVKERPEDILPPMFPLIPELEEESVQSILTSLTRDENTALVTKEEAVILSSLTFSNGSEILTLEDRYFLYEMINLLYATGYDSTLNFLSVDWMEIFGPVENIRTKILFRSPLLDAAREKFDIDLDIYRNTIEVAKGAVDCKNCGSDETISVEKQTRGGDEMTSVKVTCLQCNHKWQAQ